ncbi:hypothetical protein ACVW1A_000290 [Bradyrhizobium sp. LB1.3]
MLLHRDPDRLMRSVIASAAVREWRGLIEHHDRAVRKAGRGTVELWNRDGSMSNIARDSDIVELTDAPFFDYGDNVRANRTIRNDGTYVGKEIGEVLVKKGELGYVISIGTFLQQFYIYGVEFLNSGNRVGMKCKELDLVTRNREGEEPFLPGAAPR